jgi:hypothetical protein
MTAVTMRQGGKDARLPAVAGIHQPLTTPFAQGAEAVGALAGGVFRLPSPESKATIARRAVPIAATVIVLAWRHRTPPRNS